MSESYLKTLSLLRENEALMVSQLHQFCGINSGTDNLDGLNTMYEALQHVFTPLADIIESPPMPTIPMIDMRGNTSLQSVGKALFIRKRPELKRRILLSGHMDTVYPASSSFQTTRYINDKCVNGPGVADMKGGLIVMLHALNAFEASPSAENIGWDVFINADEEIGSLASGHFLSSIAENYTAGLVYEPAMTSNGMLAKNRRGSGKLTVIATGKAAHAGRAFDEGRNAICYLAEVISAIHALNGQMEGVNINVGLMAGGEALNVVPDKAVAKLDVRISHPEDEVLVRNKIDQIIASYHREGYELSVQGGFHRPVKRVNPATEALFLRLQGVAKQLNLKIDWKDSGGCCDGNNLAQYGLAVLDTLGVRGGEIHSPNEFILLDSLVERAALSALLLLDIAEAKLS